MTKVDERALEPEIDDDARRRLAESLDKEGIVAAMLIGSQARGEAGTRIESRRASLVDPEKVSDRLERLTGFLKELAEIRDDGSGAYKANYRSRLAAAHALQLAVQICLDNAAGGMRNVLVHDYLKVDDNAVWDVLGHLDDLHQFSSFVKSKLD